MSTTTRALHRIARIVLKGLAGRSIDDARALVLIERIAKRELDGNMSPDDTSLRGEVTLYRRARRMSARRRREIAEDFDEMLDLVRRVTTNPAT